MATNNSLRRDAAYLALGAVAIFATIERAGGFYRFFFEHNGIEFYKRRPFLLLLCLTIAIAIGLCSKAIAVRRIRKNKNLDD